MKLYRGVFGCAVAVFFGGNSLFSQTPPASSSAAPQTAATPIAQPAPDRQPAPLPSASPGIAGNAPAPHKIGYGSCRVDGPYIAMTFDDGPNALLTPKVLDMLEARHIHATFFVIGMNAQANPGILKRMIADGDEIGNHSWSHPPLSKIGILNADKEISDTSATIQQATGTSPIYLRPPYGAMTPYLKAHIEQKFGLTLIYWSVDPLDWKFRDSAHVYNEILKQVKPGAIILSHDIHPTTVAAMPDVFDALLAKGYKFVTVSQLIAMNKPRKPVTATSVPSSSPATQ